MCAQIIWKMAKGKKFSQSRRNNPRRGFPGVLCFCETGKENRCEREAKDILHYYMTKEGRQNENNSSNYSDQSSTKKLSLEEEIAMLKKMPKGDESSLKVYNTGCRGTVSLMFTRQNSQLVDLVQSRAPRPARVKKDGEKRSEDEDNSENYLRESKKVKLTKNDTENEGSEWDPVPTVASIFQDIKDNDIHAPSSRFVTRMVPMQVTCHAAMDEIVPNMRELLAKFLMPHGISSAASKDPNKKIPSFRISYKRRCCDDLKTKDMIESVANVIEELTTEYFESTSTSQELNLKKQNLFKVDLSNPDYTILIEICRTLVGMSVVKNAADFNNFNLIVTKEIK
jgi:tRNA acetyltransferase TAN1